MKCQVMREAAASPQVLVGGHIPLCPLWEMVELQLPLEHWVQVQAPA